MYVEKALPLDWSDRLDGLAEILAVTEAAAHAAESILLGLFNEGLPRPGIFPTDARGLHLEWDDEKDTEILVGEQGDATLFSDDLADEGILAEPALIVRLAAGALQ